LPDNLQKILDDQLKQQDKPAVSVTSEVISDSGRLPFEPKSNK
jgi:YidC/Oxa1 family membrane protein insertase